MTKEKYLTGTSTNPKYPLNVRDFAAAQKLDPTAPQISVGTQYNLPRSVRSEASKRLRDFGDSRLRKTIPFTEENFALMESLLSDLCKDANVDRALYEIQPVTPLYIL